MRHIIIHTHELKIVLSTFYIQVNWGLEIQYLAHVYTASTQ